MYQVHKKHIVLINMCVSQMNAHIWQTSQVTHLRSEGYSSGQCVTLTCSVQYSTRCSKYI